MSTGFALLYCQCRPCRVYTTTVARRRPTGRRQLTGWTPPRRRTEWRVRSADEGQKDGAEMASKFTEVASVDCLIDYFMSAKSRDELVKMVGENILSLNQDFWIRMATRSDSADANTKQKIQSLSDSISTITSALVKMTEDRVGDASKLLTKILTAAADECGHWDVPLTSDKASSLKEALRENKEDLDEGFLSTSFALMRRSMDDKIEGMVPLIQKMLQLYAALMLQEDTADPAIQSLNDILDQDSSSWQTSLRSAAQRGMLSKASFSEFIERKLESTIELPSGSYAQRVQVEFLTKLKDEGGLAFSTASCDTADI